jgi:hypothetical protein
MKRYNLIVEVDEEIIKQVSKSDNIEDSISKEMGWVEDSGIYLVSIKEIDKEVIK